MEGFEPPTSWLQISCSGQLSYTGIEFRYTLFVCQLKYNESNLFMATLLRVFRSFQSHLMNFFISECKDKTLFYISYCSLIFFYLFFYFFCYSLSQSLHVYEYQYIVYFIRQTIGFILTPDFTLNRHNPFLPYSNKLILLRN